MKSSPSVTKTYTKKPRSAATVKPKTEKAVSVKVTPKKVIRTTTSATTRTTSKTSPRSTVTSRIKRSSKSAFKTLLLSRSFQVSVKMVAICFVTGSSLYGVYNLVSKTFANEVVISKSEIVSRVSKLTPLPEYPPYDVVRVEDETTLRKQNIFYKDVKEGDYIVMYKDMAIVYDLRNNIIVAMRKTLSDSGDTKSPPSQVNGTTTSQIMSTSTQR